MVKKTKNSETEAEAKVSKKEPKTTVDVAEEKVENKDTVAEKAPAKPNVTKVGTLLKNMRMEKGLKVADIAKTLCIRKQYLDAIEDSNYKEIPAFPYGIGFIRSYADFLGLNSGNIVELYKEETNLKSTEGVSVVEPETGAAMPNFVYIIASIVAVALIYGVWTWMSHDEEIDTTITSEAFGDENNVIIVEETLDTSDNTSAYAPAEEKATKSDSVESSTVENENSATTPAVAPAAAPVATPEVLPANEANPVKVNEPQVENVASPAPAPELPKLVIPSKGIFIEVLEESWVEVKNAQKLYLSKVLNPGEGYTLPNDTGLILSVGKRGGVNVYVNGVKTDLTHSGKKMNIDIDSYLQSRQ